MEKILNVASLWVSCQLNLAILAGISGQGKNIKNMYQDKSNPIQAATHANRLSLLLSCGTVYYAIQTGSTFKYVHETGYPRAWELPSSTFM